MPDADNILAALAIGATVVLLLQYVVLVWSCEKQKKNLWSDALESWTTARRGWRDARAERRRATKDFKRAQRQTGSRPANSMIETADGEAAEAQDQIRALRQKQQDALLAEQTAIDLVRNSLALVDKTGGDVHEDARNVVTTWLGRFRNAAWTALATGRKLTTKTWGACRSVLAWVSAYRWAASILLAMVVVANNYYYYDRFDFNVLPYHSELTADALITVVLVVVAVTAVVLLATLTSIFLLIVGLPLLALLSAIVLGWAVAFVLGQTSARLVALSGRSARLGQLTLLLVHIWALLLNRVQEALSAFSRTAGALIGVDIDKHVNAFINYIGQLEMDQIVQRAYPPIVHSLFFVLTIAALLYVVSIDPQYRAHVVCRDDSRVRVVVNQPPAGVGDSMIRIGSNKSYLFAIPAESCSSGDAAGLAGTNELTQRTGNNENMQSDQPKASGNNEVMPQRNQSEVDSSAEAMQSQHAATASRHWISERLGFLGSNLRPVSMKFLLNLRPSEFGGAVVALPVTRVHCMYEEQSSEQASVLCARPAVPRTPMLREQLLREQLLGEIAGCEQLVVSKPFVFRPGEWEQPVGGTVVQIDNFKSKYEALRRSVTDGTLYVFGFASADGPSSNNERLALNRANTVRGLVTPYFSGWDIRSMSLGERHLTSGMANSRSARLVFCAPHSDEPD